MALIPIAQRLAEIEVQCTRLERRIERLQADRDFLVESLFIRPVEDMKAQNRLLNEWSKDIKQMKLDLQSLRDEWGRLNEIQNNNVRKNKKSYGNKERTETVGNGE